MAVIWGWLAISGNRVSSFSNGRAKAFELAAVAAVLAAGHFRRWRWAIFCFAALMVIAALFALPGLLRRLHSLWGIADALFWMSFFTPTLIALLSWPTLSLERRSTQQETYRSG